MQFIVNSSLFDMRKKMNEIKTEQKLLNNMEVLRSLNLSFEKGDYKALWDRTAEVLSWHKLKKEKILILIRNDGSNFQKISDYMKHWVFEFSKMSAHNDENNMYDKTFLHKQNTLNVKYYHESFNNGKLTLGMDTHPEIHEIVAMISKLKNNKVVYHDEVSAEFIKTGE